MAADVPRSHLSQIETRWTELFRAHQGPSDAAAEAQAALMLRYAGAVSRYLTRAAGDPHVAEDLAQDFAVRFLRGDFRHADPSKGRFRDFVKRTVLNLMIDDHRRRRVRPRPLGEDVAEPAAPGADPDAIDGPFLDSCASKSWPTPGAPWPSLRSRPAGPTIPPCASGPSTPTCIPPGWPRSSPSGSAGP